MNEQNLSELYAGMDIPEIDFDDPSLYDNDDGIISNMAVEVGNQSLSKFRLDFGKSANLVCPIFLELPFNPFTLEKFRTGQTIRTYKLAMTPGKLLLKMKELAEKSPEYMPKLRKLIGADSDFEIMVDPITQEVDGATYINFIKYNNFYTIQDYVQKFMTGADTSITRKALFKVNKVGNVDFEQSPQSLALAYYAESDLLNSELDNVTKTLTAENKTKKDIEEATSKIRKMRIMSRPYPVNVMLVYAFECAGNGALEEDAKNKYNSATYDMKLAKRYFEVQSDVMVTIKNIINKTPQHSLNYIIIQRTCPEKSDSIPNAGVAAMKTSTTDAGSIKPLYKSIDNFDVRMIEELSDGSVDLDTLRECVKKFQEISLDTALNCYSTNILQYKWALSNPNIILANEEFFRNANTGLEVVEKVLVNARVKTSLSIEDREPIGLETDAENMTSTEDDGVDNTAVDATNFI